MAKTTVDVVVKVRDGQPSLPTVGPIIGATTQCISVTPIQRVTTSNQLSPISWVGEIKTDPPDILSWYTLKIFQLY